MTTVFHLKQSSYEPKLVRDRERYYLKVVGEVLPALQIEAYWVCSGEKAILKLRLKTPKSKPQLCFSDLKAVCLALVNMVTEGEAPSRDEFHDGAAKVQKIKGQFIQDMIDKVIPHAKGHDEALEKANNAFNRRKSLLRKNALERFRKLYESYDYTEEDVLEVHREQQVRSVMDS